MTNPQSPIPNDTRRLKLLLLIPTLDRSGAEKQLALLATRLPRDRFDVHVVCLTRGGPYADMIREAGVPVTVLGKRAKGDPRALWKLKGFIQEQQPDILHCWLFAANAYGRLALPRSSSRSRLPSGTSCGEVSDAPGPVRQTGPTFNRETNRPKVVVSERCVDSWKSRWQLWLDRRLIGRTDALVANSQSVADFYQQQGVPRSLIHVIPNGIAPPRAAPFDREQFLKEQQLPPDAKLIACIGRLAKQKCVDDLLWGIQVLRQADPRAYLLVIGEGPERDALIERSRQLECAGHVRFLGHREDADRILPLVDVYWLASSFEGMSNSLMEAMLAGVPVIASDIPPNRELIRHGEHGYLVNLHDGVGFAQYSVKLLEDAALSAKLAGAAKRRMLEEFSIERMVERHAELYRGLMIQN